MAKMGWPTRPEFVSQVCPQLPILSLGPSLFRTSDEGAPRWEFCVRLCGYVCAHVHTRTHARTLERARGI